MATLNSICIHQLTLTEGVLLAFCNDGGMKPSAHKFGTFDFKVVEVFEMSYPEVCD